jgi:hypothetical protein
LALCWSRLSSMAPQEHEVGRTFYGSVPMPVEQKVVEGSSKAKTLKIVALGAVVLTAAVFAFTSPVRPVQSTLLLTSIFRTTSCRPASATPTA